MRNVIVQEFVTLDGMAAGPNDNIDFIPASTAGDRSFGERQLRFMDSIDAILLGRATYDMFAGYWPNVTTGDDKPFADQLNAIPKIVFSRTLDRAAWTPVEIVRSSAAGEVAKLKQRPGRDMVVWGSISLAQSLLAARVVDQVELIVCPAIAGRGRTLFGEQSGLLDLSLQKTETFDRGEVLLAYKVATT